MSLPPTPYPVALVEFEGQVVPPDALRSLTLESNAQWLADALELVLDNAPTYSDFVAKERPVELYLGYVQHPLDWHKDELTHVFSGAVDGVLPSWGADTTLTVRCRDHTRRLIDEQADPGWAWQNMTDADVVAALAVRAALKADIAPAGEQLPESEYLTLPGYLTDATPVIAPTGWDIVQRLAVRNGYVAYVSVDGRLYFGPRGGALGKVPLVGGALSAAAGLAGSPRHALPGVPRARIGAGPYLDAPMDLLAVQCDDSALVVNTVTVVRWLGHDGGGFIGGTAVDAGRLAAARGRVIAKTLVSTTAADPAACEVEAQARLKELARAAITATATVEGDPRLAGDVRITLAGAKLGRFKGDYYISVARHRFGTDGYATELELSSVRPEASEVYRPTIDGAPLTPEQVAAGSAVAAEQPGAPTACGERMVDDRTGLPTSGTYGNRTLAGIMGVTLHYTAGPPSQTVRDVAAYQTSPAAAKQTGAGVPFPAIAYTILVTDDGKWHLCHDLTVACWHSAAAGRNEQRVGICYTGDVEPNAAQIQGLACAILWAQSQLGKQLAIEGHRDAPYPTECPGPKWPGWRSKLEGAMAALVAASSSTGAVPTASAAANAQTRGALGRSPNLVQAAVRGGGWPEAQWDNAAAIVMAESGGNPTSVSATGDYGLFQINMQTWRASVAGWLGLPRDTAASVIAARLFQPTTNSQMAYRIWQEVGHWGYPGGWATAAGLGLK